jgi:hypothetical protein
MIEKKLTLNELSQVIQPFLRFEPPSRIISALQDTLNIPVADFNDVICQTKILVTYNGYRIDIRDLRMLQGKGISIQIQFKAKQLCWNCFRDQNAHIIRDLQSISAAEISDLRFRRFKTKAFGGSLLAPFRLVLFHDSRAFNPNWKQGSDISPLSIGSDAHHGNCFVEFFFNAGGYRRSEGTTVLRDDWMASAFDVSEAIERGAKRLLEIVGLPPARLQSISLQLERPFDPNQLAKEMFSSSDCTTEALTALLDYCESRPVIKEVMNEFQASQDDLKELYYDLLRSGAGQWVFAHYVAASALAYPEPLRYMLMKKRNDKSFNIETAYNVIMYFERGATLQV